MNFLGHLVLSGDNEEILFGNFIADSIKGKSYKSWSPGIQKGILLHRFIDSFTDSNQYYLLGKRRFYENYPKVGGVINDIIYDYLLWQYDKKYKSIDLTLEIIRFYDVLERYKSHMPEQLRFMFGYMIRDKWLLNYQYEWGIKKALNGIGRRMNYSNNLGESFEVVQNNLIKFNSEFELFFEEIKEETSSFM
jgi:acyl carrier protein phosphodiesterase